MYFLVSAGDDFTLILIIGNYVYESYCYANELELKYIYIIYNFSTENLPLHTIHVLASQIPCCVCDSQAPVCQLPTTDTHLCRYEITTHTHTRGRIVQWIKALGTPYQNPA